MKKFASTTQRIKKIFHVFLFFSAFYGSNWKYSFFWFQVVEVMIDQIDKPMPLKYRVCIVFFLQDGSQQIYLKKRKQRLDISIHWCVKHTPHDVFFTEWYYWIRYHITRSPLQSYAVLTAYFPSKQLVLFTIAWPRYQKRKIPRLWQKTFPPNKRCRIFGVPGHSR